MQIGPFGASVFLRAASVARREAPGAKAASAGQMGALCVQTGEKTDSHPKARQRFSVKLAGACFATFPRRSPNKSPEPTTMAVTPRAIARISEMKPWTPNRHAARGAPATVVAHL